MPKRLKIKNLSFQVLTLQNIMYSDSELKYITKERNIAQLRIERFCSLHTKEISEDASYRNCILIKKSTVDYFEKLGYNLFRQFETSYDEEYYRRPLLWKSDDEAYELYKLLIVQDYSLDIYCYTMPPTTARRRFQVVSSTLYVSTHSNINNSSESTVVSPLARNPNGLESISDVSQPSPVSRYLSDYAYESIWGSTSRLPTALMEPISNTFWNNLSSEDLTSSSSDSDEAREPGGIFVKLATLNSTRRRSNSTSRGTVTDEISDDEIRDSQNFKEVDDQESNNPTGADEDVPIKEDSPGTSGKRTVSGENEIPGMSGVGIVHMRNANSEMSDETTTSMRNSIAEISDESIISRRNANPGMSGEGTVSRRNGDSEMSGESIVLRKNANPGISDKSLVSRRNSNPGMSDESTVSTRNANPGISSEVAPNFNPTSGEVADVENRVKEEYKNSGKSDASLENDFKARYDDIEITRRMDSGILDQTKEKLKRKMNVYKRPASGLVESPGSSFWCSKEPKQSKLSSDVTEFSPGHISISENIRHSVNIFNPQESTIEEVKDGSYNEIKIVYPPSTLLTNNTDESILNTHVKSVTNINNKHPFGDKFNQKECSEDEIGKNVSSIAMSSSSNTNHTIIEHSDPRAVVELEYQREPSKDPQHSSFIDIQPFIRPDKESHDHMQSFHIRREPRRPCENRPYLDQIENEIGSAPIQYSNDSISSQNAANTTINQHTSLDQIPSIRRDHSLTSELNDINEDMRFYNTTRSTDGQFPLETTESDTLSMARIERQVAFYSFINQNRITESLQYPDNDTEQFTEASKSNLNPQNHALLPPLNVPLVWSRKCEDLQYLLSLKLSQPRRCIQEYNRIRKSGFNILDCLRKRETSGSLHQTKVMESIAQPHYNIYPPADEQDIRAMLEDVQNEDEMDLCGYLMVSLATYRTFYTFPETEDDKESL